MQAREKQSSASPGRVRASFGLLNWTFSVNSSGKLEWKIAQASKQTRTLEYTPFPQTLNIINIAFIAFQGHGFDFKNSRFLLIGNICIESPGWCWSILVDIEMSFRSHHVGSSSKKVFGNCLETVEHIFYTKSKPANRNWSPQNVHLILWRPREIEIIGNLTENGGPP